MMDILKRHWEPVLDSAVVSYDSALVIPACGFRCLICNVGITGPMEKNMSNHIVQTQEDSKTLSL